MLGDFSHMWREIETMFKRVLNTKLGDTKKVTSDITTDKKTCTDSFSYNMSLQVCNTDY